MAVTTAVVVDPRYLQLMATTAQLKYVDVSLLESQEDKLCFYGNLLNLMILHVVLFMVERKVSEMEVRKKGLAQVLHVFYNVTFSIGFKRSL